MTEEEEKKPKIPRTRAEEMPWDVLADILRNNTAFILNDEEIREITLIQPRRIRIYLTQKV